MPKKIGNYLPSTGHGFATSLTSGHPNSTKLDTTGHGNDNILTDTMKTELIRKLKECIEENTEKNDAILEIVNSIKEKQDGSS